MHRFPGHKRFLIFLVTLAAALLLPVAARAVSTTVVISEFRTRGPGGGNDEFIELYNRSPDAVPIGGWKIRGSNAAGTVGDRATIPAGTMLPAGRHYLLTNSQGYSGAVAGDRTYATGITDDGGIALTLADDTIIDQVGMSTGSAFKEGTPLPQRTSNINQSYERRPGGAAGNGTDTDDNLGDFLVNNGTSNPQNLASPPVGGASNPSGSGAANPSAVLPGATTLLTVTISPGTNPPSTGLAVTADLTAIGGASAQPLFDDGTNGDQTAGDNVFSFGATVAPGTTPGAKSLPVTIDDAQGRTGSAAIPLNVLSATPVRIRDIQGAGHISPYNGQAVANVPGIVTAVVSNGFYLQDPQPDADERTSEGIFVFTNSAPGVLVGDAVTVTSGTVIEFRPGGTGGANNLATTEIVTVPGNIARTSFNNPLPAPIVIGAAGRFPPTEIIEDDAASGSVEDGGVFDPANDGIDFYESLEGMRVQINDAVAVGPTSRFGEIPVLVDNGAGATVRTARGGIVIRSTDFNPERIFLDDAIVAGPPSVNVGDAFPGAIVGVLDYSFGNFKLFNTAPLPAPVSGGLVRETVAPGNEGELAVATFNVENLDPGDNPVKFDALAAVIVDNLRSPDLIALEEVQDNNGPVNDSVVDASVTLNRLIAAIQSRGGPAYQFRQINPVDDQDGGEPGGNIRVAFLFRTDRGLAFVDRPGGGPTTATTVLAGPALSVSPGRVDPTNPAFANSRKPLAGEFRYNGHPLFVIANHFNSKGGDQPLFGRFQPPARSTEVQRRQQAQIVRDFVGDILAVDPAANVVVLGDLNDFEFSDTVNILKGAGLSALIETLPLAERYSYVFEGNSQSLDHILVSNSLLGRTALYDIVHVNAEFADQISDHDPQVARFVFPAADVSGQVQVRRGGFRRVRPSLRYVQTVTLTNVGSSPLVGPVSLVLDGLGGTGVTLFNETDDAGSSPYVDVNVGADGVLGVGESVELALEFTNPGNVHITYTTRVLAGPGTR